MSYHRRACCWRGMTRLRTTVAQTATNCHWTTEIIPGTQLAAFCTATHAFFAALCPIRLMILKSYSTVVKPVPTKFTMSLRARNTESRLKVPRAKLLQAVEPLFSVWTPKSWILCILLSIISDCYLFCLFCVSVLWRSWKFSNPPARLWTQDFSPLQNRRILKDIEMHLKCMTRHEYHELLNHIQLSQSNFCTHLHLGVRTQHLAGGGPSMSFIERWTELGAYQASQTVGCLGIGGKASLEAVANLPF